MGEVFGLPTLYLHLSGDRHSVNKSDSSAAASQSSCARLAIIILNLSRLPDPMLKHISMARNTARFTTQRYVHPDTDSMIRAAEVIDFPIDDGAPRQSA